MNLKKTLIGLGIAACLAGSLFAQNKTSNSYVTLEPLLSLCHLHLFFP